MAASMVPKDIRQDMLVRGIWCPLHQQNNGGNLKYLFMMGGGALERLKLYLQLLKMIRLVKSGNDREASEGSAKAN